MRDVLEVKPRPAWLHSLPRVCQVAVVQSYEPMRVQSEQVGEMMGLQYLNRCLLLGHHYALCTDEAAFKKELKRLNIPHKEWPEFMGNGHACTNTFDAETGGGITHIICIHRTKKKTRHQICALLCHEAVHVWQRFIKDIGETNPGDETEAYAIQHISQSLMEAYFGKSK